MNIERYLVAVAEALRNDVLPALPPSTARDQVINSLRVISRLTIGMASAPDDARAAFEDMQLPEDIRNAFNPTHAATAMPPLAEEISVDAGTLRGMEAASKWLATGTWHDDPAQNRAARSLLEKESGWRSARLARLAAAEQERENAAPAIASGAKLNENTLLAYLRDKSGNSSLTISDCRPLQGGRTRKTLVFQQHGQADWPQWLVVQCDPPVGYHSFPGVSSQYPALVYLHGTQKLRVPKPVLLELDPEPFGTPFMVVERMGGSPPTVGINFFAPPPLSEKLALSIAEQMGALHGLSPEPVAARIPSLLPGAGGWPSDLDQLTATIGERSHGPSLTLSAALSWMRANVHAVQDTRTLVHGDFLLHNLLTENDLVSGILDWEAVRLGHPGEDLGYVRPVIEQMVSWKKFMAVYRASGGPQFSTAEADYFTLRAYILMLTHIAGSRNAFEAGKVDDIRAAEVGCSLAPLFVNCVGETLQKILRREAST